MISNRLLHQVSLVGLLLVPRSALAQTTVAPGSSVQISQADGSSTACQIASLAADCSVFARFSGTAAAGTFVHAHYDQVLPAVGVPNYARAAVYADFALPGSPATLVDAQISTTFDYGGSLFGAGAYKGAATLSLRLSDLSVSGVDIATQTLFEQERSGDQGLTDVNAGAESQSVSGSNSSFQVKLRRGHTYRLTFEVEVLGEALVVGKVISDASATWTNARISVDEDEVDLLASHDAAVRGALASHDVDVKKLLAQIQAQLAEIKTLLLTPEGQRPGFPGK